MRTIDVCGYIVADEDAMLYRWFGFIATCPRDVREALKKAGKEPVTVRINSYGGDVWSASDIYTALMEHEPGVETKVTGLAASAASVIMMAGNTVRASPTAEIMIHNPMSHASGDYRAMDHAANSLRNTRESIINAYAIKTGLPRERLRSMMNAETWLNAQSAKDAGFVDEILFMGATEQDDSSGDDTESGGSAGRTAALNIPSAELLRAKKAIYCEFAPTANNAEEARRMIAERMAESPEDKEPQPTERAREPEWQDEGNRFNFLLERIRTMGA